MSLFRHAPGSTAAHRLYSGAVNHARCPIYYDALDVPDTPEGRFEILALHVGLIIRRLLQDGAKGRQVAQALVDLMVADMDVNLRELGVGDLAVGKQVKRLAGQLNARMEILKTAFDGGDHEVLRPMLATNTYHGIAEPSDDHLAHLIRICEAIEESLAGQAVEDLAEGQIQLPDEGALREVGLSG
ncbi:MAG: ubiquinol-cytochrome C chaperone family protein [Geminicoccaceae bacterium]